MLNSNANDYQYLFLGGILGEILELPFVGNYLKENKAILEEEGLTDVDYKTLSSLRSAHRNARELNELIESKYLKNRKKIILFCHSKACLEVMVAIKRDVLLFQKMVHRVICVQPPFQGSSMMNTFPLKQATKAWPGLKSLSQNFYSDFFQEELVKNEEKHEYIKKHLLVIRSYRSRSRDVSWIIRPSHFIMKRTGNLGDGLVNYEEQIIPNAEYEEKVMEMDHSDLFTSGILSNMSSEFRKGLMHDLVNSSLESNVLS